MGGDENQGSYFMWPKGNTVHTNSIQCHHNFLLSTEYSDAMKSQPSDYQRNPAYGNFGPTDSSPADLLSDYYSENPAYNIDTQPSAPQEPTYVLIEDYLNL